MKRLLTLALCVVTFLAADLKAFWWPGGTMTIPVTAWGHEEFAGYVPSSPWGASNWTNDPAVELHDSGGGIIAQYVLTGGAADWYEGASRSRTASFNVPAGNYSLAGRIGRKLQLITGEGWAGFSLNFGSIADPVPPNSPPVASISGSTSLLTGQTGNWTFSASDANGNLAAWRFYASTNPGAGWSPISGGSTGPASYSTSFASAGTYTWIIEARDTAGASNAASVTVTVTAPPPPNVAPTIAWNTAPGTVASGLSYTISAHGHDQNGNMTAVSVWKNGAPFAFGAGGNGTDADSGNTTSDGGPATITFTARATDSNGASSTTISQTVTVNAPPPVNRPPAVALSGSTTLLVGQVGSWNFSASDPDSNLSSWRFYASTNPGAGWSPASGGAAGPGTHSASFGSAGTYTWIVEARDTAGLSAAMSVNVIVTSPPPATAWFAASPTTATAPGGTTVSWSTANASSVTVSGPGVSSAAANGSQLISGLAAGTYTWTLTAQGAGGPVTRTASLTVSPPAPSVSGSIAANPASGTEPLATTISWTTANATAVAVSGPGATSAASNGSQLVTGLAAGTYTYTLAAQGNGGPITRTAIVTVTAAPMFALTTAASGGGNVTPGGSYPTGSIVTVSATSDAVSRFIGWTGDAAGAQPTIALTIDRAKFAQANFVGKTAQTISFPSPGDRAATSGPFPLSATATSGLPVGFTVTGGPATWTAGNLQLSGPGAVTVQASQAGDAFFLPAPPVNQTFNSTSSAAVKYRPGARTLLQSDTSREAAPLVIEKP